MRRDDMDGVVAAPLSNSGQRDELLLKPVVGSRCPFVLVIERHGLVNGYLLDESDVRVVVWGCGGIV